MLTSLETLYSIINGKRDAKDFSRVFTFIEFIKEYGYDNSVSSFLNDYKEYIILWNKVKKDETVLNDKELIQQALTDTLKSIILTYSSYEEQDFISNIDWDNELHKKAIIPFFAEKIKHICDFYKAKRNNAHLVVNKNKFKGSRTSIEQIIYDKIVDFYLNNRNLSVQVDQLQHDLLISIEEYVDIYSDYFDIPRESKVSDEARKDFIEANINNVNYEDYIEVAKVISETLFNGEAYLEEIPLIAQLSLDFSAQCVGDLKHLRDELLNTVTINQVSLNDQILLRRKLYEKYLGCDLYYIYCDTQENVYFDVLCKAANPSGNLLNCGSADTAVVESSQLKLLSRIGLFFKPDKMGILKTNIDDFTWEVDRSKLQDETFYIFPDPNKYGNIGNNKDKNYPLVFEYKLNSYIKNISSGMAKHEPLAHISSTTWNSYYTKQDNDYILEDNKDYNYSFTNYSNSGLLSNYQVDSFGNEYGLFKFYKEGADGKFIIPSKYPLPKIKYVSNGKVIEEVESTENISQTINKNKNVLFNGGYFRDPRFPYRKFESITFPHDERIRILDDYNWSGLSFNGSTITSNDTAIHLDFGTIADSGSAKYIDHYEVIPDITIKQESVVIDDKEMVNIIFSEFTTQLANNLSATIVNADWNDFNRATGTLLYKEQGKPFKSFEIKNIKNFYIINDLLIIDNQSKIVFYKQTYNNGELTFIPVEQLNISAGAIPKLLYNESKDTIYISVITNELYQCSLDLYKFSFDTQTIEKIITKDKINQMGLKDNWKYQTIHDTFDDYVFSYNNELDVYLIAYILKDKANNAYFYKHQFRLYDELRFQNTLETEKAYLNKINNYIFNPSIDSKWEIITEPIPEHITNFKNIVFFEKI